MVNSIRVNESTGLAHCWGNTTDDFPPEYENYECLGSQFRTDNMILLISHLYNPAHSALEQSTKRLQGA